MEHIEINEVQKTLGNYIKLSNLVANNKLEVCYRLNAFVASVDLQSNKVNSIQSVDDFFLAEKTEELIELIRNDKNPIELLATKNAVNLKHPNPDKDSTNKWVFLEKNRHTLLLKQAIDDGQIVDEIELIPDERIFPLVINSPESELLDSSECLELLLNHDSEEDDLLVKINASKNYGLRRLSRQDLYITKKSWDNYKRNPKTNSGIDRATQNSIEDLHQLILILKHIILEESGAKHKDLTDQIMDLLSTKESNLNVSKINKIFGEVNKRQKNALRKNIIKIFKENKYKSKY
ncbi:hypothetical protein [Acinetobacter baumannii]|uniref:hypothetical protein n=1 Tax=Acinetobacter baumannii TaxID=470 RepID=UPI0002CF66B8|nr:hypothetical protein [Acinetobacter baumannii]ENU71032.1 hypothetical protein F978_00492 [Acinetobacter baumannii NIPH 615]